MNYFYS